MRKIIAMKARLPDPNTSHYVSAKYNQQENFNNPECLRGETRTR